MFIHAIPAVKSDPVQPIPITDLVAPPFPLNHARILYNNVLFTSSIASTNGRNRDNTIKPNNYERITFDGNSQITYTLPTNQNIDTICLGGHNLSGSTIRVYYDGDSNGMLRHLASQTATENALMFHFDQSYSAKRISVKIESEDANNYIGYISAGIALQLQRPFFGGHNPITDGDESTIEFARTQSGQIVSNSLMKRGIRTDVSVKNLNDNWVNTYFLPFQNSAKTLPFFFAWNLLEYPNDVGLVRVSDDIKTTYSGITNLHDVSFNLLGV